MDVVAADGGKPGEWEIRDLPLPVGLLDNTASRYEDTAGVMHALLFGEETVEDGDNNAKVWDYNFDTGDYSTRSERPCVGSHVVTETIQWEDEDGVMRDRPLIVGGMDVGPNQEPCPNVYMYLYEVDEWRVIATLPLHKEDKGPLRAVGSTNIAVMEIDEEKRLYIAGGTWGKNDGTSPQTWYLGLTTALGASKPAIDHWTRAADMPVDNDDGAGRTHACWANDGEFMYIFGGWDETKGKDGHGDALRFDPVANEWDHVSLTGMPVARGGAGAGIYDPVEHQIWCIGGEAAPDKRVDVYDIVTNSWFEGPELVEGSGAHYVSWATDTNTILVWGGEADGSDGAMDHVLSLNIRYPRAGGDDRRRSLREVV